MGNFRWENFKRILKTSKCLYYENMDLSYCKCNVFCWVTQIHIMPSKSLRRPTSRILLVPVLHLIKKV
jgi:hypothetical protein